MYWKDPKCSNNICCKTSNSDTQKSSLSKTSCVSCTSECETQWNQGTIDRLAGDLLDRKGSPASETASVEVCYLQEDTREGPQLTTCTTTA